MIQHDIVWIYIVKREIVLQVKTGGLPWKGRYCMNRVIIEKNELGADNSIRLFGYRAEHIINILHAGQGSEVKIGLLNGPRGRGTVVEIDGKNLLMKCSFEEGVPKEPPVDLLLAMPRPKVMRRLWSQLSAIGTGKIILVNAEKVERQYFDNTWLDEEVYRKEMIRGLEQSGETFLPQVLIRKRLKPFLEDELDGICGLHDRVIADPHAGRTDFRNLKLKEKILLAVGPEGGWTDFETGMFEERGFKPIGLGSRILRSDTACIVLTGLFNCLVTANAD